MSADEEQHVFRVTLPLPPSVNRSLRPARMGKAVRLVHTDTSKQWARTAAALLARARKPAALLHGPVAIRLEVHVPTIASDGPNRQKALEDALVRAGVLSDDRQIAEWGGCKRVAEGEPRVVVELRPADPGKHPNLSKRLATAEGKRGGR